MTTACETVATAPTNHVAFAANNFSRMKIRHIRSDFDDLADKFMSDHQRNFYRAFGPGVPVVNVNVRAADSSFEYTNQNIVDPDLGGGNIFEPQAFFGPAFNECFHVGLFPFWWSCRVRVSSAPGNGHLG